MPPELSIVIPTMGRPILIQTLKSILAADSGDRLEVIVVGEIFDHSVLRDMSGILSAHPDIRHIPVSWPKGDSSRKKNRGAKESRAQIIAFLDDDVVVAPNWPQNIIKAFEDPETGLVCGPSLVPPDVSLTARLAGLALSSRAAGYAANRYRAAGEHAYAITWSRIIGCNAAYRKSVFTRMGGFPPEFYPGEEMIAAWRTQTLGYRLQFIPSAWVYHYPRQTLVRFGRQMREYGATRIRLIRAGVPIEWQTLLPSAWILSLAFLGGTAPFCKLCAWLLTMDVLLYAGAAAAIAAETVLRTKQLSNLLIGFMVPVMHLSYGIGQLQEFFGPNRDFSNRPDANP